MILARLSITSVLLLVAFSSASGQPLQPDTSLSGQVVEVTDGDTYRFQHSPGTTITVQLWAVDTPELDQPYGPEAAATARQQLNGRQARLHVEEVGEDGRFLVHVTVRGQNAGKVLIREGLAWHYTEHAPGAVNLSRLEQKARSQKRGLWAQTNPVPPWMWRTQADTSDDR